MSKKVILFFATLFFIPSCHFALANLVINEVQLKPTGESFIELYNSGSSQDLTGWSIKRKTASGLEYQLVSASRLNNKSISSNDFFVLTNEDYIGAGTSDATWAKSYNLAPDNMIVLYNANEDLVDKVGWGNVSECDNPCLSNPTDGKSIQKTDDGSWVVATPTPGVTNESLSASSSSDSNNSNNTLASNEVVTENKTKVVEEPKIKTSITVKNVAFVGIPIEFQGNAFGYSGEKLSSGRYFWNFGDGDSKEVKLNDINNQKFTHTYFYPGEYVVSLEYYLNYYGNTPDAFNKITLKVAKADIVISKVGDEKDFFIELTNNTEYDTDISNWIISSNGKNFTIPRNTIIRSEKKMIISSKITNFFISDKNNLKLLNPQWEVVFDYGSSVVVPVSVASTRSQSEISLNKNQISQKVIKPSETIEALNDKETISVKDLSSSVISSDSVVKNNSIRIYVLTFILTIFIGGCAFAVYSIRQKRVIPSIGDDFKILDE